jgi:hypothetical protein
LRCSERGKRGGARIRRMLVITTKMLFAWIQTVEMQGRDVMNG